MQSLKVTLLCELKRNLVAMQTLEEMGTRYSLDLYRLRAYGMPNFATIGQTVAYLWPFLIFSRWRPSAILDLLYAYLRS